MSFQIGDIVSYVKDHNQDRYEVVGLYKIGTPEQRADLKLLSSIRYSQSVGEIFDYIYCSEPNWGLYKKPEPKGHPLTKIFK